MRKDNNVKLVFTVFIVISFMGIFLSNITKAGELEPTAPPGSTMHSLNDIYNLLVEKLEGPPRFRDNGKNQEH